MLLWVNAGPGPGPGPLAMGGNFSKKRVLEKIGMSHLKKLPYFDIVYIMFTVLIFYGPDPDPIP